jgi:Na+/proline symporter
MLVAVGVSVYYVSTDLGISGSNLFTFIAESDMSQIFFFEDWKSGDHFVKQFISGAFIAIVMTGLDQDMMQKNLTCRNLKDAQKNMFWFTIVLTIVNFVFLVLGLLLTVYAQQNGIDAHKDQLYPTLAMQNEFGISVAIMFILGLIAAAYSSADSAMTALTTSFSIDILEIEKKYDEAKQVRVRKLIHILVSFVLILVIIIFNYVIADDSVIAKVFVFAGYTYGPLLGLYAYGLFTKWNVKDKLVPVVAILTPFLGYGISHLSKEFLNFEFGFFILILNGALTFLGLILIRSQKN